MLTITTNHVPRVVIDAYELSPSERETFDYIDWAGVDAGSESAQFARYRGELYDLSEMMLAPSSLSELGWQGYASDSYFSGVVVRFTDDNERVVVGRYYS